MLATHERPGQAAQAPLEVPPPQSVLLESAYTIWSESRQGAWAYVQPLPVLIEGHQYVMAEVYQRTQAIRMEHWEQEPDPPPSPAIVLWGLGLLLAGWLVGWLVPWAALLLGGR